jgi:hypothetical protein
MSRRRAAARRGGVCDPGGVRVGYAFVRLAVQILLRLFYARIEVVGRERIPPTGALIIAPNHHHTLDLLRVSSRPGRRKRRTLTSLDPTPQSPGASGRCALRESWHGASRTARSNCAGASRCIGHTWPRRVSRALISTAPGR